MNKRNYLIYIFIIIIFSTNCSKDSNPVTLAPDNIVYQKLNDTLIRVSKDTLNIFSTSANSIFEIYGTPMAYYARLSNKPTGILCDCGHDFMSTTTKGMLRALNFNDFITGNALWGSNDSLYNLSNFSGKGERFLGFRLLNFSSGTTYYNYGWVRLYCSSRNDTLRIIDYAVNHTVGNGIKAGQE